MDEVAKKSREFFERALRELPLVHPGRGLAALGLALHEMAEKERAEAKEAGERGALELAKHGMTVAVAYAGTSKACVDAFKHIADDDERRHSQ